MAPSLLNAGLIALIRRRGGYCTAAVMRGTGSKGSTVDSNSTSSASNSPSSSYSPSSSWIPDPVTGYYRPDNRRGEVDAAEMRESLLSSQHKSRD